MSKKTPPLLTLFSLNKEESLYLADPLPAKGLESIFRGHLHTWEDIWSPVWEIGAIFWDSGAISLQDSVSLPILK